MIGLIAVGAVSAVAVWVGGTRLERAADRLASYYALPPVVQGAVIVAIGSSMPELLTAVFAPLLHGNFELGVSVIVGSAVFNVLVIPAAAAFASDGTLNATPNLVYKEAQFYLLSVTVFILTLSLAVIYRPAPADFGVGGNVTRGLALVPLGVYGLYVFLQYADTVDHDAESVDDVAVRRQWLTLLGGLVIIAVGVEGLLRFAIGVGDALGTESFVWGLTVIAVATSLPDTVVSVTSSRRQNDVTSIANVFGSNVFDLLVAVPAGVIVAGETYVNFSRSVPLLAYLVLATVVLFTLMRTRFELSRWEAGVLLFTYAVFVVWVFAESFGAVGLLAAT
ncbi:MAG: sodium:calcium antiporter [Halobacteriales archaeon]